MVESATRVAPQEAKASKLLLIERKTQKVRLIDVAF